LLIGGIDEAGRGSVIGPLVIAGISLNSEKIHHLKDMGVTDSKKISPSRREKLFNRILLDSQSIFICKINCSTIDRYVIQKGLNKLECKFMTIVANNIKADKIIVDCCDVNIERFKQEIKKNLINKNNSLYCFHKADLDNITVSAASILAKVTRDREIKKINQSLGVDVGSGYPSDPKTKLLIQSKDLIERVKNHVRFSWLPIKKMTSCNNQDMLV
jgi:ribonuclease HII